jgi:hypothetical protein
MAKTMRLTALGANSGLEGVGRLPAGQALGARARSRGAVFAIQ